MEMTWFDTFRILELQLCCNDNDLDITIRAVINGEEKTVCFYNASAFSADSLSVPLDMNGLRIVCNKQKGWESDVKYEIEDYENGRLRFFCERFEIL